MNRALATIALALTFLAGCGAAAEEAPPPMESSLLETGMIAHAERPAVVAVDVEHRIDAFASRVFECLPGRQSLAVELGVRRSGSIYEVRGGDLADGRACVRNALLGATVSAPLTSDLMLSHTFVRGAAPEPPPPATTVVAPREDPTRASLAALVDAHAPEILACAGRAMVAVRVRWDASGQSVLALQGDLAGSAEEACVRDAIGAPTLPPGSAGDLVRLVRAPAP